MSALEFRSDIQGLRAIAIIAVMVFHLNPVWLPGGFIGVDMFLVISGNGIDALALVLMAWGVGPGVAIFVPSFTYVASAEAPAMLGATPVFVDVDGATFNIDPNSLKTAIEDSGSLGLRPKAVVVVDLFGQPCEVHEIIKIAHQHGVKVLVDGAQSFGASLNNQRVGTLGDATTTSFFPAKPLGCYGDGGAIFTNNSIDADLFRSLRLHGKGQEKYDNVRVGINSRLDTLQAAILIEKLKIFPQELDMRQCIAEQYSELLGGHLEVPCVSKNRTSSWAQFTLKHHQRDEVKARLAEKGIPTAIYYPKALHQQTGYRSYPSVSSGLSVSDKLSNVVFSIPMHPYLTSQQVTNLSKEVISAVARTGR